MGVNTARSRLVETAAVETERTLTEPQVEAVAAERARAAVEEAAREHAALVEELRSQLDAAEAQVEAERTRADGAEAALASYQAEVAAEKERAEREEARTNEVRAAAPGLSDDYFTSERAARWSRMSEEAFADVVASLKEVAGEVGAGDGPLPRETAMSRKPAKSEVSLSDFLNGKA